MDYEQRLLVPFFRSNVYFSRANVYYPYPGWPIFFYISLPPLPLVSREIMHIHGTNMFIYQLFEPNRNGKGFESLRPLQVRQRGPRVSRFRARHDASPTLKPNLRHFQSSEIKNTDRLLI